MDITCKLQLVLATLEKTTEVQLWNNLRKKIRTVPEIAFQRQNILNSMSTTTLRVLNFASKEIKVLLWGMDLIFWRWKSLHDVAPKFVRTTAKRHHNIVFSDAPSSNAPHPKTLYIDVRANLNNLQTNASMWLIHK